MCDPAKKDGFSDKLNSILDQCCPLGIQALSLVTLISLLTLIELDTNYVLVSMDLVPGTTTDLAF